MSSQEMDRLLSTLKINPDDLKTDVDTQMSEFDDGLTEAKDNPDWSSFETRQDDSAGEDPALSDISVPQPRSFPNISGSKVMRMAGKGDQLDRLDSKRGKDGPALNPESYGYVQERNGHSRF
jgi:hypothetical protein